MRASEGTVGSGSPGKWTMYPMLAGYSLSKGMRLKHSEGLIEDAVPIAGEDKKGVFFALGLPCSLLTEREIVDVKPLLMPS